MTASRDSGHLTVALHKRFLAAFPAVLLAAAPLGAAAQEPANSVRVYKAPRPLFDALPVKQFGISPELGRAWIDVALHERFGEGQMEFHRVYVPGLSYDASRREVVYEADGRRVVCARNAPGGQALKVKATGVCKLSYRLVMGTIDDGSKLVDVPKFEVHLTVPAAEAAPAKPASK